MAPPETQIQKISGASYQSPGQGLCSCLRKRSPLFPLLSALGEKALWHPCGAGCQPGMAQLSLSHSSPHQSFVPKPTCGGDKNISSMARTSPQVEISDRTPFFLAAVQ